MSLEVGEGKAGVMSGGVGGSTLKKKEVERGGEGSGRGRLCLFW